LGLHLDTQQLRGVEAADDGVIDVDETMMTGYTGLFAGGDMVPAERTVTVAAGHGKKAACRRVPRPRAHHPRRM